ncbi:hypothetical protein COY52_05710 [Candidatus Desantisbacteria bacterium CG_4_10_14_0_8_um_filter_48_22]|uniref:Damage-control phosphatase ARMT1-like metal-binding domain-containing protein n=1 Tax=Candidatus Desantisbacteria bacterium CG_4_10_14_0_8_um_filter_48_22 TaxID=1974543 RepID=A0A2M7SBL5_9BACT|nr:MAG: hypothetical protein AUJ67_06060 [Candidatus Desantisbacteria bacterium CG1_02_49_89]PIV56088.1 MAG: hypothetical protein COS16_04995 [Candidatus Desantisbacteria bacterium CG02_land_8_20_14_3_00_49_13]PIZ16922.1 MAG: hypothetical protein COY52_05710 [Candidatus Desantisbacteria bacterium CG_4_10_14_0_8_um_filter_48_22]
MKSYKKCIACFYKQAKRTTNLVTDDPEKLKEINRKIASYLKGVSLKRAPADLSTWTVKFVYGVTGCADPYKKLKDKYNRIAKKAIPWLKKMVVNAPDPILMGLKVAVAGNIIDLGILTEFDLDGTIKKAIGGGFPLKSYKEFRKVLDRSKKILYILDNSGEIVFDRPLIEELIKNHAVTAAVKSGPILNDATMEDAAFAGLTKITRVIKTGNSCLGVNWRLSSKEFKKAFREAGLIISKGQANYETLDGMKTKAPVFFLMQSKCPVVAKYMGVKLGVVLFLRK